VNKRPHDSSHTDLEDSRSGVAGHHWNERDGAFYCTRAAMPLLQATKGNVVNVTSVAGLTGPGKFYPLLGEQGRVEMHDAIAGPRVRAGRAGERGRPPARSDAVARRARRLQIREVSGTAPLGPRRHPDDHRRRGRVLATGTTLTTGQVLGSGRRRTMYGRYKSGFLPPEWGDLSCFRLEIADWYALALGFRRKTPEDDATSAANRSTTRYVAMVIFPTRRAITYRGGGPVQR